MSTELTTTDRAIDPLALIAQSRKLSKATKDKYTRVLTEYLDAGGDLGDARALAIFADALSNSRRAHLRAAVGRWAGEMIKVVKGSVTPETVGTVQATIMRFESLVDAIEVQSFKGEKAHTWLSQAQVRAMYQVTGPGIVGDRDRVALGLLVAAGLRREEAVNATFADLKLQPVKGRLRTVLDVEGKGARNRVIPISDDLANLIDTWGAHVGHTGLIIRSLGMNREPGESMSAVALFKLVRRYGEAIGKPDLAAHDLRRTYAQVGYEAGVPITQISKLLGHASVATTQRYLNLDLDLDTTASDFVPWG